MYLNLKTGEEDLCLTCVLLEVFAYQICWRVDLLEPESIPVSSSWSRQCMLSLAHEVCLPSYKYLKGKDIFSDILLIIT